METDFEVDTFGKSISRSKNIVYEQYFSSRKMFLDCLHLLDQKNKSENSHFLLFVTLAAPSEYVSATVKTGPAAKVRSATSTPATS